MAIFPLASDQLIAQMWSNGVCVKTRDLFIVSSQLNASVYVTKSNL